MDKKQKIIVAIFTAIVIIGCAVLVVFVRQQKQTGEKIQQDFPSSGKNNYEGESDETVRLQLQTLDDVREKQNQDAPIAQAKTEEEKQAVVQQQIQQLDDIRSAQKIQPLTQQQIDDQMKQLDALRGGSK